MTLHHMEVATMTTGRSRGMTGEWKSRGESATTCPSSGDDIDPSDDYSSRSSKRSSTSSSRTSRRARRRNPRQWIKPEKYNGKGSWETFIAQFNNCAIYNQWKTNDKIAHLRWAMSDMAAQLLCGTEGFNFDQLVAKLAARFGGTGIEEKFQNELRCRRRGKMNLYET